jgi:outer membrane biosynthesis protein TonB
MNCQSCAMPLNSPSDHALGNEQNPYCAHCADANGNLKSKEEVREGMINYYTQTEGKTREEAERVVDAHMGMQPAWQQNPPTEPVVAPEPSMTAVPEPTVEPVPSAPLTPEPVVTEMPSTPVAEETAPAGLSQQEEQAPVVGQSESLPTPEPVNEVTSQANPTETSETPASTDSSSDNSGTSEV